MFYSIVFYVFISAFFDILHERGHSKLELKKGILGRFARVCTHDYAALHLDECNAILWAEVSSKPLVYKQGLFSTTYAFTSVNRVQFQPMFNCVHKSCTIDFGCCPIRSETETESAPSPFLASYVLARPCHACLTWGFTASGSKA